MYYTVSREPVVFGQPLTAFGNVADPFFSPTARRV